MRTLRVDSVPDADWIKPGEKAAFRVLRRFVEKKLASYDTRRNDPSADGQSDLSPYLHFGQISAQRVALEVSAYPSLSPLGKGGSKGGVSREAFLEELIVRRELSDNYCFYNKNYDTVRGLSRMGEKDIARP